MAINFPDSPSVNDTHTVGDRVWNWNGTYWTLKQNASTYSASDTAPSSPDGGDLWYESDTGNLYVYYGSVWIEVGHATDGGTALADADGDTMIQVEEGTDDDTIRFDTAGVERMVVKSDGKIGIGTTTPTETLHVYRSDGNYEAAKIETNTVGALLRTTDSTASTEFGTQSGKAVIRTANTPRLTIDATGKVGIGTTTPTQTLDVNGIASASTFIVKSGTGTYAAGALGYTDSNWGLLYRPPHAGATAAHLFESFAGADLVAIKEDGKVGIGITTPQAALSFANSTGNKIDFYHTTTGSGDRYGIQVQANELRIHAGAGGVSTGGITFGSSTTGTFTERMRITNAGNAYLGTTSDYGGLTARTIVQGGSANGTSMMINTYNNVATAVTFYSKTSGAPNAAGSITLSGATTAYNTSSDYRMKENVTPMVGAVSRVAALNPVRFNWIIDPDGSPVDGFLAHEAAEVVPEAVNGEKDAMRTIPAVEAVDAVLDDDGNEITPAVEAQPEREEPDYQGIDQSKLVPLLVGAIQELTARIETLEAP